MDASTERGRGRGGSTGRGGRGDSAGKGGKHRGSKPWDAFRKPEDIAKRLLSIPQSPTTCEESIRKALKGEAPLTAKTWTKILGLLGHEKRWDLAVCALDYLRSEGIDVNEYHCGSVISACEKSGQWQAALQVLQGMREGIPRLEPNHFCFSAAIGACAKAGEAQHAMDLLAAMGSDGLPEPNHYCYSAGIRACAQAKWWSKSLELLSKMQDAGETPTIHSYTGTMSACMRAGQWQRSLSLLEEVKSLGLEVDVPCYGAAIGACQAGGHWQRALTLLEDMSAAGLAPNVVAYNSALAACESGRRWEEALCLLQRMRQHVAPDILSYSTVVGACESAGRTSDVKGIRQMLAQELKSLKDPAELLHCIVMLAKLAPDMDSDAPAAENLSSELNRALELVAPTVPEIGARDLGNLLWALARLRVEAGGLLSSLQARLLALEELPWQTLGQADYALRFWNSTSVALGEKLRRWGSQCNQKVVEASVQANAVPSNLLLSMTGKLAPAEVEKGPILVVDDRMVAMGLKDRGCKVYWWGRMSAGKRLGSTEPPECELCSGGAVVRLSGVQSNNGGAGLQLPVAGAALRLPPGSSIWLCGLEEDGIGDAALALQGLFEDSQEVARDCGARVLRARRRAASPAPPLAKFGSSRCLSLSEVGLADVQDWAVWPGLFAGGGLDVMTSFLLQALKQVNVAPGAAILDFCCGSGAIAQALLQRQPEAEVHLSDADAFAIEAARRNLPAASSVGRCYLGDGWHAVPEDIDFDWIISNPPVHRRRQDDFSVVEALIAGAARKLRDPGGRLWIVAQVHVPVGPMLQNYGFRCKAKSDGRFVLWRARAGEEDRCKRRKMTPQTS